MKKKAKIELCESEIRDILAEYFQTEKANVCFTLTENQLGGGTIVSCNIYKEMEFPQKESFDPKWNMPGVREITIPYSPPVPPTFPTVPGDYPLYDVKVTCDNEKGETK